MKTLSLVCWEWYHNIALAWKDNININLKILNNLTDKEYGELKDNLSNSLRYFANIKIPLPYLGFGFDVFPRFLEVIKLIRIRDSMTYKNIIRNVSFFGSVSQYDPIKLVDIFTALGKEIVSVHFEYTPYEWGSTKPIDIKLLQELRDIIKNIKVLNLGWRGSPAIAALCTNLDFLKVSLRNKDDGLTFEKVLTQNMNIRHLVLHLYCIVNTESIRSLTYLTTLELKGDKYNLDIKLTSFLSFKGDELRSLVVSNSTLNSNDLRAMEVNFLNLVKLDLELGDLLLEPKYLLLEYFWNLKNLKELRLKFTAERMNFQYENVEWRNSDTINSSLVEASYCNLFFNKLLLEKVVRTSPNLRKLHLEDIELDLFVDSFYDCLKNLPYLEHLILK